MTRKGYDSWRLSPLGGTRERSQAPDLQSAARHGEEILKYVIRENEKVTFH